MITRFSRIALIGLVFGWIAYIPFATTAVSTREGSALSRGLLRVAAEALQNAPPGNLSPSEQSFVANAHARGLLAIGAGQVAFQASSIHEVRLLAAHTLTQRAGLDEKLVALAKTKGMAALPDKLDASGRETLETLAEASGDDDFELRYCGIVVAGYLRDIRAFQGQAETASDPDLRELAAEIAADLRQHLAIALVIQHALTNALKDAPVTITVSNPASNVRAPVDA